MPMQKRHVVFDTDDTLLNSYKYNQDQFVATFLPYWQPHFNESLIRAIHFLSKGKPMNEQFQAVAEIFKMNISPEQLARENEKQHEATAHSINVFDTAIKVLKHLKKRQMSLHICSNRPSGSLNIILKQDAEWFSTIISCADEGHEKPDPYCLLQLIKRNGGKKEEFIYVGDSPTDAEFASAAGVDFIQVDNYLACDFEEKLSCIQPMNSL